MSNTVVSISRFPILVALLMVIAPVAAQAGDGDGGGMLAFTWQPLTGGLHQIHAINADGTGDRLLIDAPIGLNHHEWSPDARRIASVGYIGTDNATWSIHVVDADGRNLQRLTTVANVWDSEPTWSPDGGRIAFCRIFPDQEFRSEMWVMNADGSDLHWIGELGFAPRWSPDGTRFIYQSAFDDADIHTCAIDGSDVRVLFASADNNVNPDWSPDGAKIAFAINVGPDPFERDIWVMNVDGTDLVQLTDEAGYDDVPRWSPDGSLLAFDSELSGHSEIYVMNPDGTGRRRVTTMPDQVTAVCPSWCPTLSGPYLGRPAADVVLERFPPFPWLANADWFWHGAPTFSPDGLQMYATHYDTGANRTDIFMTEVVDGIWTWPRLADFSSESWADNCPVFSASGDTLYFHSARDGGGIFRVVRTGVTWSESEALVLPRPAGTNPALQFSVARNGDIYGELWVDGNSDLDLFCWRLSGDVYAEAEELGPLVNSVAFDFMPFVDPQQRFLVFASARSGGFGDNDIWLCENAGDGGWSDPVNAGPEVNTAYPEIWSTMSPDGAVFFVSSGREGDLGFNPYWMEAAGVLDAITATQKTSWGGVRAKFR